MAILALIDSLSFYLLTSERKREKETIDLLFLLFLHSLTDSSMGPDLGWNLQPPPAGGRCSNQATYLARALGDFLGK